MKLSASNCSAPACSSVVLEVEVVCVSLMERCQGADHLYRNDKYLTCNHQQSHEYIVVPLLVLF